MGSEAPANTNIFFKDKQNELKGPFTERQVQEWYRKKLFDSSFQFFFVNENETPGIESEFHTLDTLCTHNGIGCPYKWIDRLKEGIEEDKRMKKQETMESIEMELAQLRVKCAAVIELQKRIGEVEKKVKELPSIDGFLTLLWKDGKKADEKPKQTTSEEGLKKFNEWTDSFSDFFMEYVNCLQTTDISKLMRGHVEATIKAKLILTNEEARLMCVEKMIEKMKKRMYLNCSLCGCVSFNYKQFLIHFSDPTHILKAEDVRFTNTTLAEITNTILRVMKGLRTKWMAEEEAFAAEIAKKYVSVRFDKAHRPTRTFAEDLETHYLYLNANLPKSARAAADEDEDIFTMSLNDLLSATLRSWKRDGLADRMMAELDEHIGSKMTYCLTCRVVTGTREEYYRHLLLTSHLRNKTSGSPMASFQTITVNMLKKNLVV